VALNPLGVAGKDAGVTALDALEAVPAPLVLSAVTRKVYGVPFVRLEIVYEVVVDCVSATTTDQLPSFFSILYPVIAEPPSDGAVHASRACWSPRVATGAAT